MAGPAMISVTCYAKKLDVSVPAVYKWCRSGNIPGVQKVPHPNSPTGFVWMIPEDAIPRRTRIGRPKKGFGPERLPYPPPPKKPKRKTRRETAIFLRRHAGGMTYGEISQATGWPTLELRALYDHLHKRFGS